MRDEQDETPGDAALFALMCILSFLGFCGCTGKAHGADKPIDPAVAWAWSQPTAKTAPAPPTIKYKRVTINGQLWDIPVETVPEVAGSRPFQPATDTGRAIPARNAAEPSSSFRGATLTGRIGTNALWITPAGFTNCGPVG